MAMASILKKLAVPVAVAILVSAFHFTGWLDKIEFLATDLSFKLFTSRRYVPATVVIIDKNTIKDFGIWPISRDIYVLAFQKIYDDGALGILVDLDFSSKSSDAKADMDLADFIQVNETVALAVQVEEKMTEEGVLIRNVSLPFKSLADAASAFGSITFQIDSDGAVRKMPRNIDFVDEEFLPLGVLGARMLDPLAPVTFPAGSLIEFSQKTLEELPVVPLNTVLDNSFEKGIFKDRVVFLGATSQDLHDFWITPIGVMPGVFIQTSIMSTSLNRSWYVIPDRTVTGSLIVVFSFVLGAILGRTSWRKGSLVLLTYLLSVVFLTVVTFYWSVLLQVVPLVLVGLIQYPVQLALHSRSTEEILEGERKKTAAILKMSELKTAEDTGRESYVIPLILLRQALGLEVIRLYFPSDGKNGSWRVECVVGDDVTIEDTDILSETIESRRSIIRKSELPATTSVFIPIMTVRKTLGVLFARGSSLFEASDGNINLLFSCATQTAYYLESRELDESIKSLYVGTINAITRALDTKDYYSAAHSELVLEYVKKFGNACRLTREQIELLHVGTLLHDIGKIGIPDDILSKPGALTSEEYEKIKTHPALGWEIIRALPFPDDVKMIIYHHHERFDGSGYPDGLKGQDIPLIVRIFSILDVYEALVGDRPYKESRTPAEARAFIKEYAGKYFDPDLVETFLTIF